jgi:ubiquitin C-terminal hydrolase
MPSRFEKSDQYRFQQATETALEYDLVAVSNHHGAIWGGHYTAYSRSPGSLEEFVCVCVCVCVIVTD